MEDLTKPKYLQSLNAPQLEAVQHVNGPILVLAGAGSGKTRVLTHRIAHLILAHNVRPTNILAVTFTNKAANEMKERLKSLLGDAANRLWVATFHSTCLRILRQHASLLSYPSNFVVYDDNDSKHLIKRVMCELRIDEKKTPANSFSSLISRAKNDYISAEEFAKEAAGLTLTTAAEVYQRYQESLMAAGAMDFDDLLTNTVTLFSKHPEVLDIFRHFLHYILVDEFQDTNRVQYLFIKQLTEPRRNIFVVGDDDQSIYAFRGANPENILSFEKDFPGTKVVTLEQNYRSTQTILEAAYSVISRNTDRKEKKLWTSKGAGSQITSFVGFDEDQEGDFIAKEIATLKLSGRSFSEIAIFYRTNAQSRALEEALLRHRIPYRIYGGLKFYERKEIKDILAYLKLIANDLDSQSFLRAINTPPRGIGAQTLQKIAQKAEEEKISLWQAAVELRYNIPKVNDFVTLIEELKTLSKRAELGKLITEVIKRTGYEERLRALKEIGNDSRIENLRELISIGNTTAASGETPESALQTFLDKVSLTASDDLSTDEKKQLLSGNNVKVDAVSLMTLHLAKGLEFPVVFLTGMEEGLLPHYRSLESEDEVAEERRLCYVGITRAKQILYLTRAAIRGMFSAGGGLSSATNSRYRMVSRFFNDIPPQYLNDRSTFQEDEDQPFAKETINTPRQRSRFNSYYENDEYDRSESGTTFTQKRNRSATPRYNKVLTEEGSPLPPTLMQKLSGNISIADQALDLPTDAPLLRDHPEKLVAGLSVLHSNFGRGRIISINEPASKDPNKTKLRILFDNYEKEKTLLLGKARLAIVE